MGLTECRREADGAPATISFGSIAGLRSASRADGFAVLGNLGQTRLAGSARPRWLGWTGRDGVALLNSRATQLKPTGPSPSTSDQKKVPHISSYVARQGWSSIPGATEAGYGADQDAAGQRCSAVEQGDEADEAW